MSWQQFEHGWRRSPQNTPATSLVVLMHGVGSNARDLMPLADIWSEDLPGTAFVSLDGTDPFDGGFGGRQWFSLRDVGAANREARVAAAYPALRHVLDAELAHWQLSFDRLALVGFSQGSIMALHHVASSVEGAAGVVAYSGRLASPIVSSNRATPLTLVHGENDEVIPVRELESAADAFNSAGYAVDAYVLPGVGHTITADGVALGRDALERALGELSRD
ncbi:MULTISPECIES: alpha/beta hydrolase [unclassified Paraburkholderia]|uniref:alpha/beta hydrolase n=1 Tax=unclassified Paraburkholderia TaxID=2615204 RepID=UPI00160B7C01|nr:MULTISPECIES: dienelactone hydrolase family protein [unclassified Paraburkholderia]MBB5448010.1 phospholipase/carboxylesterase [Paraburkholderia sp. WSM4177]MBB5488447.1 phospholipase/carboxylesterase [Paraburkholderia sp. WSM4180]